MTTIIIDTHEGAIYTDRMVSYTRYKTTIVGRKADHSFVDPQGVDKVWRPTNDHYITGCGSLHDIENFVISYTTKKLRRPNSTGSFVYVCVKKEGGVQVQKWGVNTRRFWYKWELLSDRVLTGTYITDGSGGQFALGALAAGVTPEQAIIAASLCDTGTGSRVEKVILEDVQCTETSNSTQIE